MITLEQAAARVGSGVVYRPHPGAPAEDGEITFVSNKYVFVRYQGDASSKATSPRDLDFLAGNR